jgi:hypothetical protein
VKKILKSPDEPLMNCRVLVGVGDSDEPIFGILARKKTPVVNVIKLFSSSLIIGQNKKVVDLGSRLSLV